MARPPVPFDDEIKKALKAAGLEHLEEDVILECGLIEARVMAGTIADRFKEEHGKESRNESGVSDSERPK